MATNQNDQTSLPTQFSQLVIDNNDQASLPNQFSQLVIDNNDPIITIECGDQSSGARRSVLCKHSDVLEREINSPYFEESKGNIKHEEYGAGAVERMIRWMYIGDYDAPEIDWMGRVEEEGCTPSDVLKSHVLVHGIASYYNIRDLGILAAKKFSAALIKCDWPTPAFADVVDEIYKQLKSEDKGLRAAVVQASLSKAEVLLRDPASSDIAELNEFSADIVAALSVRFQEVETAVEKEKANAGREAENLEWRLEVFVKNAERASFRQEVAMVRAQRLVNATRYCQGCEADFDVRVEQRDGGFGGKTYVLKCLKCSTEHG